jgi:Cu/Zn superoxide dismutase
MGIVNRKRLRITAATVAAGAIAVAGATLATSWAGAQAATAKQGAAGMKDMPGMAAGQRTGYGFSTLNNANDPTFNQLLGINNHGVIAGYFGSGAANHPNKGYELFPPHGSGSYVNENFPGSVQTQVTGLNDKGDTVGFWSSMNNANLTNDNFGFYKLNGHGFHSVKFPTGDNANPPVDQLLGINSHDVAVGFYTNGQGSNRGFTYNIKSKTFVRVLVPGYPTGVAGPSLTAAGINDNGDVAGFYVDKNGNTDAFLARKYGKFRTLDFPGASATQAFGVNDRDEVVGAYTDGTGSAATMHGFTWTPGGGFASVDDPHGAGTTTINGVNDEGDLVGFYVDGAGNTDGFLAKPLRKTTVRVNLMAMPAGTITIGSANGQDLVQVAMFGLTPGSAHTVLLHGNPIGTLTADATGQASASFTVNGVPGGSRVKVLNGTKNDSVSRELIAETSPLDGGMSTYRLTAVEVSKYGTNYGTPAGHATITYDPNAQTITVTLTASGVTPGAHAAHIHIGSCQSQGPVQSMLQDFSANGNGNINHETRVVTGVTTPLPASGWYLNLHQGDMNNILSNGQPTIAFRPLLCANINS